GPGHAALHLDDLTDVDGVAEVHGFGRGGHHDLTTETRTGDGGVDVHQLQRAATEERAQGIGVVGEDGVDGYYPLRYAVFVRTRCHRVSMAPRNYHGDQRRPVAGRRPLSVGSIIDEP